MNLTIKYWGRAVNFRPCTVKVWEIAFQIQACASGRASSTQPSTMKSQGWPSSGMQSIQSLFSLPHSYQIHVGIAYFVGWCAKINNSDLLPHSYTPLLVFWPTTCWLHPLCPAFSTCVSYNYFIFLSDFSEIFTLLSTHILLHFKNKQN